MAKYIRTEKKKTVKEMLANAEAKMQAWVEEKIAALSKKVTEQEEEITRLKEEVERARNAPKSKDVQPSIIDELNTIKAQVSTLKEEEEKKARETSSWAEVLTRTAKQVEEAEKWIEGTKRAKAHVPQPTPTSPIPSTSSIIKLTLEEEQRRRARSLHVRVTGVMDRDDVQAETKELCDRMGILEPKHTGVWRVGKKPTEGEGGTSKERALILRFPTMEVKQGFLSKRKTLKDTGIYLGDDLTLSQIAHMMECMPKIRAARASGKLAFYRDGRVVILEKRKD